MDNNNNLLSDILEKVSSGIMQADEAFKALDFDSLKKYSFVDMSEVRVDTHRGARCGAPEAIFCRGKKLGDIISIAMRLYEDGNPLIATKANENIYRELKNHIPQAEYFAEGNIVIAANDRVPKMDCNIALVTAGTSDIPVAKECYATLKALGLDPNELFDVGVAGIHRLMESKTRRILDDADIVIVVAGMDGVLPSAVSGLVKAPVIAVPTSVGYGASFGGLAALLTMLNSCAPGIAVVNIDNGFGAAVTAYKIARSKSGKK